MSDTPEEIKRKRKRQSDVYQYYLNKDWKKKFQNGGNDGKTDKVE